MGTSHSTNEMIDQKKSPSTQNIYSCELSWTDVECVVLYQRDVHMTCLIICIYIYQYEYQYEYVSRLALGVSEIDNSLILQIEILVIDN